MQRLGQLPSLRPLLIGFTLLIAATLGAGWSSERQQNAVTWVRHTLEVKDDLSRIQILATAAETGQRGFLLSGQAKYLVPYDDAVERLYPLVDKLAVATSDNPRQQAAIERLRPALKAKLDELASTVALMRFGQSERAIKIMRDGSGREYMVTITDVIAGIGREEDRLLMERTTTERRAALIARSILLATTLLVVLLAISSVRDGRRRYRMLADANEQLQSEMTEKDRAQDQVRQLQKMEAVGQLTGGIAHDFNNMLAIVIGSLDIARRRLTGVEHSKVLQCIENASEGAERAATLTGRLLAFSRQQPLQPKVLDANKLVGGMSELLRRTIGDTVEIETVLSGGLWRVSADASQVENAVVNLAVNARDAMPGGGKLTIETSNTELDERYARQHAEVTPGQYVMISVSDTGTGMAPETIERAFDPFYTTKGIGKGTGLGLSQVFGFIKQSAGHVKIYSEVGHGTTLKIYLPRYTGSEIQAETARVQAEMPLGNADEIILVVEDEDQVRRVSVDALRELGYTVIQASNGIEALASLTMQPHINLLFTDIMMLGMTGRELAEAAKEHQTEMKVLYTTGYSRNSIVHNGIVDSGMNLITKPYSLKELAWKVRQVLGTA